MSSFHQNNNTSGLALQLSKAHKALTKALGRDRNEQSCLKWCKVDSTRFRSRTLPFSISKLLERNDDGEDDDDDDDDSGCSCGCGGSGGDEAGDSKRVW